jgi:hypothetical protein
MGRRDADGARNHDEQGRDRREDWPFDKEISEQCEYSFPEEVACYC